MAKSKRVSDEKTKSKLKQAKNAQIEGLVSPVKPRRKATKSKEDDSAYALHDEKVTAGTIQPVKLITATCGVDEVVYGWRVEYAKSGRSKCHGSGQLIPQDAVRIGKEVDSSFKVGEKMHVWYLVSVLFDSFKKGRASKNKLNSVDQLEGFDQLQKNDQDVISTLIDQQNVTTAYFEDAEKDATYLEFAEEKKWWSITVSGSKTRVRWGAIGVADNNISEKDHKDSVAAEKFKEKMVKEKTGKGYVQTCKDESAGSGPGKEKQKSVIENTPPLVNIQAVPKRKKTKREASPSKEDVKCQPLLKAPKLGVTLPTNPHVLTSSTVKLIEPTIASGDEVVFGWRVEYAKSGRSKCHGSGQFIPQDAIRIGKEVESSYKIGERMHVWYLVDALFQSFRKGRSSRNKLHSVDQLEGFEQLKKKDQDFLASLINEQNVTTADLANAEKDATYLECVGENKWWSISISGPETLVRWGTIGIDMHNISEKKHKNDSAAEKFKEKMLKEKTGKGYVLVEKK